MIDKISNTIVNDKVKSVYGFNDYSIQDLLSKFFEKINECIDNSNLSLSFLEWLKGEGLEKEVIKEIEKMYNDGRLTELVNIYANELKLQIDGFRTELDNNNLIIEENKKELILVKSKVKKRNFKKIFGYNVMWGESQDLNGNYTQKNHIDMMNDVKHCEELGIDEITIAMYIGYNIQTNELYNTNDVDYILSLMELYKNYNVKMKTIKLHLSFSSSDFRDKITYERFLPKYKIFVQNLCNKFKNTTIENIIIYNEFPDIYCNSSRDNDTVDLMNIVKNNGYKVGISTRGYEENCKISNRLLDNSDLICANIYPKISFKGQNTTFQDSENAWEQDELNLFFEQRKKDYPNKERIISETGVINCWEDLEGAVPGSVAVTRSSKATEIYLRGLFNVLRNKPINRVWWWFGIYPGDDNNLESLFNYEMRGIEENE